jgi:hypothetical protein
MVQGIGNAPVLDWQAIGWDFTNAMSAHEFDGRPSVKLWPQPASFVFDGTACPVCLNSFGPEGGFHLGTCEHIYHPMCLISLMIYHRRCAICKAPFHEHLYDLFGLVPYMPASWEVNPENAPELPSKWGEDLVWSWCLFDHALHKSQLSSQFGWENDHEEILRVSR